jgi:hypothetical protein
VVFRDGTTVLGSPSLTPGGGPHCSRATVTTSNLLPGTHSITAQYAGDGNYLPAGIETLSPSQTVSCDTTFTGDIRGSVHATGNSTCIINATVHGAVTANQGALFIGNSTVRGAVTANHTTFVGICGNQILGGALEVRRSSRFVVIGDPGDDGCATNSIRGAVTLDSNQGGAELVGNVIGGALVVNNTRGTGPFPEDVAAEIEGNTIRGALSCNGNVPPPINDGHPNAVGGARTQQCRLL